MDLDDDIKKKHDLRTVEGRKNAEHEQLERSSTWIGKFFKLVWFLNQMCHCFGNLRRNREIHRDWKSIR